MNDGRKNSDNEKWKPLETTKQWMPEFEEHCAL